MRLTAMRLKGSRWFCLAMVLGMVGFVAGCGVETTSTNKPAAGTGATKEDDHDHDHGHDHEHGEDEAHKHDDHVHGPNGGHVIALGDEEYHIEWDHEDESGLVTIYLLDKEMKNLEETDAESITIETKVGENANSYTLPRVPSESETRKVSKFEITDKTLLNALLMTEGVTNTLKMTIGGKEFTANIKHDPSHDH